MNAAEPRTTSLKRAAVATELVTASATSVYNLGGIVHRELGRFAKTVVRLKRTVKLGPGLWRTVPNRIGRRQVPAKRG